MFDEVDELVKKLLVKGIPLDISEVDVVFDAPTSEWKSSLARPTLNCYLYHIVENHELRRTDWELDRNAEIQKNGGMHKITRRRMPYRIDTSYMITAWANEVEDEHRLLWKVLSALMRYHTVPPEYMEGELLSQAWQLPMKVGQPEGVFKNPSDFWSGMEVHVKPGVNLVLTVALDPERSAELPLVLTRRIRAFPMDNKESGYELPTVQFGGWLSATDGDKQLPVPETEIMIVEKGRSVFSDEFGRYKFDHVPHGRYTLRINSPEWQGERQVDVPGEDYDLVLTGRTDRGSSSSDKDVAPGNSEEPPDSRQRGQGRRR